MSIAVERSRPFSVRSRFRSLIQPQSSRSRREQQQNGQTTTGLGLNAMFQDARNTSIHNATFNIFASGSSPVEYPNSNPVVSEDLYSPPTPETEPTPRGQGTTDTHSHEHPQTSPEIYVDCLIRKNRGYPLWIPSPSLRLPICYRRVGISIGDLGIITPEGAFSFLFNVLYDASHPINSQMRLPSGFVPFQIEMGALVVEEFRESSAGSFIADDSVVRTDTGDNWLRTVLHTSAPHAAVLMLPEDMHLSTLNNPGLLRKYVAVHLEEWYRFARDILGRDVANGDLRVVSGCRKSVAFGIATVSNSRNDGLSAACNGIGTELTFDVAGDARLASIAGCKYRWSHRGCAEVKAGPSLREHEGLHGTHSIQQEESTFGTFRNQCLFVNTIDGKLSAAQWAGVERVVGSVVNSPVDGETRNSVLHFPGRVSSKSSSQGFPKVSSSSSPYDSLSDAHGDTSSKSLLHPSDALCNALLQLTPTAKMAIVCDEDWSGLYDDSVEDVHQLVEKVLSNNSICEEEGMAYFIQSPCATDKPTSARRCYITSLVNIEKDKDLMDVMLDSGQLPLQHNQLVTLKIDTPVASIPTLPSISVGIEAERKGSFALAPWRQIPTASMWFEGITPAGTSESALRNEDTAHPGGPESKPNFIPYEHHG